MELIKKSYVIDEHKKKVAVQIDLQTFEKIEKILEDYALGQYLHESEKHDEFLTLNEAKVYYKQIKKPKGSANRNQ